MPLFSSWFFVFTPEGNECITAKAEYCGKCIQAGAKCGWCKDPVCEGKQWLFSMEEKGGWEHRLCHSVIQASDNDVVLHGLKPGISKLFYNGPCGCRFLF